MFFIHSFSSSFNAHNAGHKRITTRKATMNVLNQLVLRKSLSIIIEKMRLASLKTMTTMAQKEVML